MRGRWALVGGMAVAAGAAYRAVRRRGRSPADGDPAAELRRKLDESRAIVEERDEFESAETPVDRAVEERRREVHDEARAAIDEMRGRPSNGQ